MANDLEKLVRSYTDELQELNDAATALLTDTSIDGSEGVQLDGLGQIIGLPRQGLTDEQYQAALKAWVRVNDSSGTIEEINEIVRLATNTTTADKAFRQIEDFPAGFKVEMLQILAVGIGPMVAEAIYQAKLGGVGAIFEYHQTEPVFAFDGANGGSKFDGGHYLKTAIRNRGARESEIL